MILKDRKDVIDKIYDIVYSSAELAQSGRYAVIKNFIERFNEESKNNHKLSMFMDIISTITFYEPEPIIDFLKHRFSENIPGRKKKVEYIFDFFKIFKPCGLYTIVRNYRKFPAFEIDNAVKTVLDIDDISYELISYNMLNYYDVNISNQKQFFNLLNHIIKNINELNDFIYDKLKIALYFQISNTLCISIYSKTENIIYNIDLHFKDTEILEYIYEYLTYKNMSHTSHKEIEVEFFKDSITEDNLFIKLNEDNFEKLHVHHYRIPIRFSDTAYNMVVEAFIKNNKNAFIVPDIQLINDDRYSVNLYTLDKKFLHDIFKHDNNMKKKIDKYFRYSHESLDSKYITPIMNNIVENMYIDRRERHQSSYKIQKISDIIHFELYNILRYLTHPQNIKWLFSFAARNYSFIYNTFNVFADYDYATAFDFSRLYAMYEMILNEDIFIPYGSELSIKQSYVNEIDSLFTNRILLDMNDDDFYNKLPLYTSPIISRYIENFISKHMTTYMSNGIKLLNSYFNIKYTFIDDYVHKYFMNHYSSKIYQGKTSFVRDDTTVNFVHYIGSNHVYLLTSHRENKPFDYVYKFIII